MTEIRPGLSATFKTREACEKSANTARWIEWADRHGFAWRVGRRHYYNLPSTTEMESYDHEPKESRYYWELHVEANESAYRPDNLYMGAHHTLDEAIAATKEVESVRADRAAAARQRLSANLSDLADILPTHIRMGTMMGDDLYAAGGRSRELHEAMRDGLISESDLRLAIEAVRPPEWRRQTV